LVTGFKQKYVFSRKFGKQFKLYHVVQMKTYLRNISRKPECILSFNMAW
jgi:hypothetical protein